MLDVHFSTTICHTANMPECREKATNHVAVGAAAVGTAW